MHNMKKRNLFNLNKVFVLLLVFLLGLSSISCSKSTSEKNSSSGQNSQNTKEKSQNNNSKMKIALVMKTLTNPFFIEMEKGARKAESELGIELIVKTGAKETY